MATTRLLWILIAGAAALTVSAGTAPAATPSDACKRGYVWRLANAQDHVCVSPQTRRQVLQDSKLAASRIAAPGSDTCKTGFVFRAANDGDHVCVTPQSRDQALQDNAAAASRLASILQGAPATQDTSPAQGGADARCTILSAKDFGKVVPIAVNPAPVAGSPCQAGGEAGFVSASSSTSSVDLNAVCQITSSGGSIGVPYHGNPAPALGSPCAVGAFHGTISRTSATAPVTQ